MQNQAQHRVEYTEPLTGTLAEAAEQQPLGVPYSPLKQTWQVNPGSEEIDPSDTAEATGMK